MKRFGLLGLLMMLVGLVLVACQSPDNTDTEATQPIGVYLPSTQTYIGVGNRPNVGRTVVSSAENRVTFSGEKIKLSMTKPADWESFPTEYGIVIGERFGSVATAGVLEGLVTYVFVTPLQDFTLSTATETNANLAQRILNNEILSDPIRTANLAFTSAESFTWDGYDAAYYLLSGDDGNATVVIGVIIPSESVLLSCSLSAPASQRDRLRQAMPDLLDGLTLNAIRLSGDALEMLPDPLVFPIFEK